MWSSGWDVARELIEQRILRRRECSTCGYVVQTPDEVCTRCGGKMVSRKDDNLESFARRWKDFEAMTLPVAKYYEARGMVVKMTVTEEREPSEGFPAIWPASWRNTDNRKPNLMAERIHIKSPGEIAKMQKAGAVTAEILMEIGAEVHAGRTTREIRRHCA